jgi:hypothetical protein
MSITSDNSRVKDKQLVPGTLLSVLCLVRTERNERQAIFDVLLCAKETRVSRRIQFFTLNSLIYCRNTYWCLGLRKLSRM